MKNKHKIVSDLVSVLTPCFNSEQYISSLLDSVLMQDYPFIEMIVVDDGSTDNSVHVIEEYIPEFNKRGYSLSIIRQKNTGQSGAIKNGLNHIHGEYLVWPDSDDYYTTEVAISKMVSIFKSSDSTIGMVRTWENVIRESDNGEHAILSVNGVGQEGIANKRHLFRDCLLQTNGYYYVPGAYMIKTQCLFDSMSDFFVHKEAGQNAQLMLPILYHYNCFTIPEVHYNVRVRQDSHSRRDTNDLDRILRRYDIYRMTYLDTVKNISNINKDDLIKFTTLINDNMDYTLFLISCTHCSRAYSRKIFKALQAQNINIAIKHKIMYYFLQIGILPIILRLIHR